MVRCNDHWSNIGNVAQTRDLWPKKEHKDRSQKRLEECVCHGPDLLPKQALPEQAHMNLPRGRGEREGTNLGVLEHLVTPSERGLALRILP